MPQENRAGRIALYTFWGLALAAASVTTLIALFLTVIHCTDGDGGVPYVAVDSAQADVCGATGDGLLPTGLAIMLAVLLAIFAFRGIASWASGSGVLAVPIALTAVLAAAPLVIFGAYHMPVDECTGEAEAAYDAWIEAGSSGDPPYDCAAY